MRIFHLGNMKPFARSGYGSFCTELCSVLHRRQAPIDRELVVLMIPGMAYANHSRMSDARSNSY